MNINEKKKKEKGKREFEDRIMEPRGDQNHTERASWAFAFH